MGKDKAAKLDAKLKKQTMKAGNTAKKLRKALGQQSTSADSSLSHTTPS